MRKKFISGCFLGLIVTSCVAISALGINISPNYGTSKERLLLYYDGYVQCQPSYNDGGRHAARASFTYKNGSFGTKTWLTSYGSSINDSNIYSKSGTDVDSLNPVAPKVTFTTNFNWVPHGSTAWPVSLSIVD